MALGEYYDEALLAQKVYGNFRLYNGDDDTHDIKSAVKIPSINGNAAYEYRVINVHENTETGYYGVAFQKYVNGVARDDIVISHRGTDDVPGETRDKENANLYIATDGELGNFNQLNDALSFYNSVASNVNEFSSIKQVGHSLGGALSKLVFSLVWLIKYVFHSLVYSRTRRLVSKIILLVPYLLKRVFSVVYLIKYVFHSLVYSCILHLVSKSHFLDAILAKKSSFYGDIGYLKKAKLIVV